MDHPVPRSLPLPIRTRPTPLTANDGAAFNDIAAPAHLHLQACCPSHEDPVGVLPESVPQDNETSHLILSKQPEDENQELSAERGEHRPILALPLSQALAM